MVKVALAALKNQVSKTHSGNAHYSSLLDLSTARVFNHALDTPLSTLNLTVDLLDESLKKKHNKRYLHQLKVALEQLKALLSLVNGKRAIKRQEFDVLSATQEVAILFRERGIFLTITPNKSCGKFSTFGPKLLFQEALSCLISNAIQAYNQQISGIPIVVACKQNHSAIRLDIIDLGKGMSKWQQMAILIPGVSFKGPDRGIGLPFAKRVIENTFQGQFCLDSVVGRGTRVSIILPKFKTKPQTTQV